MVPVKTVIRSTMTSVLPNSSISPVKMQLDLSTALDWVDHALLLEIFSWINFPDSILSAHLRGRNFLVCFFWFLLSNLNINKVSGVSPWAFSVFDLLPLLIAFNEVLDTMLKICKCIISNSELLPNLQIFIYVF